MYLKRKMEKDDYEKIHKNLASQLLKLRPEPSCDFCGSTKPVWMYAAMRLSTGQWWANWRWLACEECSKAVDSDKWDVIKFKIYSWLRERLPNSSIAELDLSIVIAINTFKQNAIKLGE